MFAPKTNFNKRDKGMGCRFGGPFVSETMLVGADPLVVFCIPRQPVEFDSFKSFGEIAD